jgi:hypothetical protein
VRTKGHIPHGGNDHGDGEDKQGEPKPKRSASTATSCGSCLFRPPTIVQSGPPDVTVAHRFTGQQ